jgi:hypothetical protein
MGITMTSKTTTTIALSVIIALAIGLFSNPLVHASAGTVESFWWKQDPGMCYNTSSLDDLTFDSSTGNGADVETVIELSRSMFNAEMNGITITGDNWLNCFGLHFDIGSEDLTNTSWAATEFTIVDAFDPARITQSEIRFNTDHDWETDSNSCSSSSLDLEWIANHEMGHGIGLKHHDHTPPESMMHWQCVSTQSTLQTVDDTAINIRYP